LEWKKQQQKLIYLQTNHFWPLI